MLVRRSFSLDTERDADLLAWLDAQANISHAIRTALRAHNTASDTDITLETVYAAVKDLETHLAQGTWRGPENVSPTPPLGTSPEDPELAAQLDQLGL